MIGSKVRMGRFYLVVELNRGGSVTNGATQFSSDSIQIEIITTALVVFVLIFV